jgi:4-hydroxy-2-oxoheptanedioate aldolase
LLGVKLVRPEGIAHCEEIVAVPGFGFAELGPGDLGLTLGYVSVLRDPYPPEMREAREHVFAGVSQIPHCVSRDGHAGEHNRQAR